MSRDLYAKPYPDQHCCLIWRWNIGTEVREVEVLRIIRYAILIKVTNALKSCFCIHLNFLGTADEDTNATHSIVSPKKNFLIGVLSRTQTRHVPKKWLRGRFQAREISPPTHSFGQYHDAQTGVAVNRSWTLGDNGEMRRISTSKHRANSSSCEHYHREVFTLAVQDSSCGST